MAAASPEYQKRLVFGIREYSEQRELAPKTNIDL